EVQHLRLTCRKAEDLLWAVLLLGKRGLRRREIEPRALGEQLDLAEQRPGPYPGRDGVRLPQRHGRHGAGGAGRGERFGLAPTAVRHQRQALEPLPGLCALRPRLGPAGPPARSYSASARASHPPAFGVTAEASAAARRATAM